MSTINEMTQAEMQEYVRSVQTLLNNIASEMERFRGVQSTMTLRLSPQVANLGNDMDNAIRVYNELGYDHVGCDLDLLEFVLCETFAPPRGDMGTRMITAIDAHLGNIAPELDQGVVVMTKNQLMATFVSSQIKGKRWVFGPIITTSAHPWAVKFREVFEDSLRFFTTGKSQLGHDGSEYFHVTKVEVGDQVCYRIEMVGEDEE